MYVKLRTWNGTQQPACFYIQNKGLHSGRPLRKPIRNCFAVYTDDDLLFEKVYSMFIGRLFEPFIGGSVVPFIRKREVLDVITTSLSVHKDISKELHTIRKIDEALLNIHRQITLYKQMQLALCRKINS